MPCNCTTGAGSPEGAVSGVVGDLYSQSNGANGQTLWRKRFATAGAPPVATKGWALMQGSLDVLTVKDFGAVGDGTTSDTVAFADAISAAQAAHKTLIVPVGTYAVASLPNLAAADNWALVGVGGIPTIKHTGAGIAFDLNGSVGTASRTWNVRVENIAIEGNANTTIGFRFRALHHSIFRNLHVLQAGASGTAYKLEWTVASLYEQLVCTSNENNGAATLPRYGIVIDDNGTFNSQDNLFLNPIIEGLQSANAIGLHLINGSRNWFIGGTIEANTKQVQIEADCGGNMLQAVYFENATGGSPRVHATDHGQLTHWISCRADGLNSAEFHIEADAKHTVIVGGEIANLVLKAGGQDACLIGTTVTVLTDNGTRTHRSGVYDTDAGLQIANKTGASLTVGGNVNFVTDNANDVGGNGTTRPRDVYVARQVVLQGAAPALRANSTVANGTVATTLGSTGPAGATAGAPRGWLPISAAGVTRYIPFW